MKRFIAFLVPVVLLTGLIGWRINLKKQDKKEQDKAAQARKTAAPSVNVAEATRRDIVHNFEGIGAVEAPFNVKISARITGLLTQLNLREGDPVTAGQIVAHIDPVELKAQVGQQRANVAAAQARLAQAELTANSTDVGVTSQIKQQKAAVNNSRAVYNQAVSNYDLLVASAVASIADAQSKVDSAESVVQNALANLESAKASFINYQTRFNRTNNLYKQGFVAAQDVDDARTQLNVQQSAVDVAQGQVNAAKSAKKSTSSLLEVALKQSKIGKNKGKTDIAVGLAALKQSQASLEVASANTSQRSAYRANLDALRAAVSASQAQLQNAEAQLSQTDLRSSITGFVTGRYLDPGTVATAGQPILAVQAIQQIYVTTSVPEDVSRQVKVGMSAEATFDALPGRKFTGSIAQVNPAADAQTRQFAVKIKIDNAQNAIKPGMFARVKFTLESFPNVLVVPREAIKATPQGKQITVIDASNVAHPRAVKTGAEDTAGIEIKEGAQPGDKVVILSQVPLKEGQTVKAGGAK